MTERRESERLSIKDIKIQLIIDHKKNIMDPVHRDVRDISYKGLSFYGIKDDHVKTDKNYKFIISSDNKSLMGNGRVLYFKNGYYGVAFSKINYGYIQSIFEFLDPAYAGEHMAKKNSKQEKDSKYLRYESIYGSFIEYSANSSKSSISLCFYDKNLEWNTDNGLSISINDDVTGKRIYISAETSILTDILSQFKRMIDFSKIDHDIKHLFEKVVS